MTKVKTLDDLVRLRDELRQKLEIREKGDRSEQLIQVKVAMATCGIASGAKQVMDYFIEELPKRNISAVVTQTGCMGYCYAEPTVEITLPGKEPVVFGHVNKDKADEIIEKYLKAGELVDGIIPQTFKKPS
ncbi:MAG: (2Fe-2S) ferredoxin domain-containing protein [Bacteroidales bacterium]|nr:(2Fe-2S) ferredoxin domain-containing protein [Bacteroidales bacterium]